MLVDDPPANAQEPDLFKGKARTYYGRWTYKYEIGTAKNAAGVILIHTTPAAGYGWNVVSNSWGSENSFMKNKPGAPALKFAGWMTEDEAQARFHSGRTGSECADAAGIVAQLPAGAARHQAHRQHRQQAALVQHHERRRQASRQRSEAARRSDPLLRASRSPRHRTCRTRPATRSTTARSTTPPAARSCWRWRASGRSMPAPKRSVYFAAVAAEEQGLIGSAYLAQNPPLPSGRIALGINYDMIPELGRVRDVNMNGIERTTFYPAAQRITKALGLSIIPDPEPEQGHYYRSDHFSFGKVGIPAFSIDPGQDVVGKPAGFGAQWSTDFRANHYHQPSDQFDPNWDWSEAVQMGQLGIWMGWEAANAATMPNWKPGDEFRAARDRATAAAK